MWEPAIDAPDQRVPYRWLAMGVVLFGTFMVVLDTTVVNLGLPSMQRDFETVDGVEWVVTAYLAAVGVAQMTSGWVADRFGRRDAFLGALVTFTIASVLCALAPDLELLIAARVLQGVGGGMLMPVAMAMIYELFDPDDRGRALGIFGIAVMAAPAIGPVLGGGLVGSVGWRWLFLINVPIGLIGIPVAARILRDTGFRQSRPFDWPGLALSALGLVLLLVGVSLGGMVGWDRAATWLLTGAGVVVLVAFTLVSVRARHPLVDMRILANPIFAVAMICLALMAVGQYTRLVYMPLELGAARGIPELQIGLAMLPGAIGIAITMPLGGRLADKVGARAPVTVGLAVMTASYWPLSRLSVDTPLPTIGAILFVGGLGAGLAMMAPSIVALNAVESRLVSQASGLSSVTRQLSAAVGTAVLAAVFASIRPADLAADPGPAIAAYNDIFLIGMVVLVAAFVAALFLPGKTTALALQAARRDEASTASEAAHADAAVAVGMEG